MNRLLNRDITLRSLSVLFAVILWFIVLDNTNPPQPKSIVVPLQVINEESLKDKGLGMKNKYYQTSVSIVVKARKDKLNSIVPDDFQAVLDFSNVDGPGSKQLSISGPFYIGKEKGVMIEDVKPRTVSVDLERIVEDSFHISIETTGAEKKGFQVVKKTVTPEVVSFSGFESLVKSVGAVKVIVDVTNLDQAVSTRKECRVYNKNGEEIMELSRSVSAEVKLEVAKEVTVTPVVRGAPAKNYIEGVRSIKPEKVLITGTPDVLAKIDDLKTDVADIENATKNMDIVRPIKLPEGAKLFNAPQEATISIAIEQLAKKDLVISGKDIVLSNAKVDNTLKYEILTASVNISLRGKQAELDKVDAGKLNPVVDAAGLNEGVHKLPLRLTLPPDIQLAEDYSLELKISKPEPENREKTADNNKKE